MLNIGAEAAAEFTPSRRRFPGLEFTTGGATFDALLAISPKAAVPPPPSFLDPHHQTPCSVRRSVDHERLESAEETESRLGKRYMRAPEPYLWGGSVIHEARKCEGRKHSVDLVALAAEENIARLLSRGHVYPQRRHICESNRDLCRGTATCPTTPRQGLRPGLGWLRTSTSDNVALALGSMVADENLHGPPTTPKCRKQRYPYSYDNLIGAASLVDGGCEERRPSRRMSGHCSSLLGACDFSAPPSARSGSGRYYCRRPMDNLFGAIVQAH